MADSDQRIIDLAARQDGLITAFDLEGLSISPRERRTRAADGRLVPVQPTVWLLGGMPFTWKRKVRSDHLATRGVVASVSAAAYQDFEGIGAGAVEVALLRGHVPRLDIGRIHRVRILDDIDVRIVDGIPMTTPARTLIDIAPRIGPRRLKQCLDHACRQGLIDLGFLRWRLSVLRASGVPGVRALDELLTARGTDPIVDSWLERVAVRALEGSGLPEGRWQVHLEGEWRDARVDLFFDEAKLVIEFEGHGTHATRKERQEDAERRASLTVRGYCVVSFTYEDVVDRPDHVIRVIRSHLLARSGTFAVT
jgi:hypothetical protein